MPRIIDIAIKHIRIAIQRVIRPAMQRVPLMEATGSESMANLGYYAAQVLKNPALDAALKKIEAELFIAWKTSPPSASVQREHLYYRMEGLAQFRLKLTGMVNNMLLEARREQHNQGQAEGQPEEGA